MSAKATPAEGPPDELRSAGLDGESVIGANVFRREDFGGLAYSRACDRFYAMDEMGFQAIQSSPQPQSFATCPAQAGHEDASLIGELRQRPVPDR